MSTDAGKDTDGTQVNAEGTSGTDGSQTAESPTLTQAQSNKAVSDALTKAGRDADSLSAMREAVTAERTELDTNKLDFQVERDAAEDAAHKNSPDLLVSARSKRELDRQRAENERVGRDLTVRTTAIEEREKTVDTVQQGVSAARIAQELGVAIEPLLIAGGTEETMRSLAVHLTKVSTGTAVAETPAPDSGRSAGGVEVTGDNIDSLWLEGKVTDDKYNAFLRTGQLV